MTGSWSGGRSGAGRVEGGSKGARRRQITAVGENHLTAIHCAVDCALDCADNYSRRAKPRLASRSVARYVVAMRHTRRRRRSTRRARTDGVVQEVHQVFGQRRFRHEMLKTFADTSQTISVICMACQRHRH